MASAELRKDAESPVESFIVRWSASSAAERANFQSFAYELCDVVGVQRPEPATSRPDLDRYAFEYPVTFKNPDGSTSTGRIDLYKRSAFVMEAKQGSDQQMEEQLALFGGTQSAGRRERRSAAPRPTPPPCSGPAARRRSTPRRCRSTMAGRPS